jgi:hypothetical protein
LPRDGSIARCCRSSRPSYATMIALTTRGLM